MDEPVPESMLRRQDAPISGRPVPDNMLPERLRTRTIGGVAREVGHMAKAFARGTVTTLGEMTGDNAETIAYRNKLLGLTETAPTIGSKIAEFAGGMAAPVPGGGATSKVATAITRGVKTVGEEAPALTKPIIDAARQAHAVGYDLPPSYIGGAWRKTLQTAVGKVATNREISAANELITDRLAKADIGLLPKEEFTAENFDKLREIAYKAYEAVRKLGKMPPDHLFDQAVEAAGGRFAKHSEGYGGGYFFDAVDKAKAAYRGTKVVDAGETLDEIRSLRFQARKNLGVYEPEKNALGLTQRHLADALEDRLDRFAQFWRKLTAHSTGSPQPDLVKDLRAARTSLAKIETVEDSIGPSGHVRASDFKKLLEKNIPLTGHLRTIGETATHFSDAVQQVSEKGSPGAWSAVDYMLGGTGLLTGHATATAAVLAKPIIRKALQSESAQKSMIKGLGKDPGVASKTAKVLKRAAGQAAISADTQQESGE